MRQSLDEMGQPSRRSEIISVFSSEGQERKSPHKAAQKPSQAPKRAQGMIF